MSIAAKLRRAPGRLASGAFILNEGIGKLSADDERAKRLHEMAVGSYPFLAKVEPKLFVRGLSVVEIALGSALLLPVVPAGLAGVGLVGFSASLLGMWWRTPGMHEERSPRPSPQGAAMAKDVWMLAIGAGLVIDAITAEARTTRTEA